MVAIGIEAPVVGTATEFVTMLAVAAESHARAQAGTL
jgi:hypothetical protein